MNLIKNTLLGVLFLQLLILLYIKVFDKHASTRKIKKETVLQTETKIESLPNSSKSVTLVQNKMKIKPSFSTVKSDLTDKNLSIKKQPLLPSIATLTNKESKKKQTSTLKNVQKIVTKEASNEKKFLKKLTTTNSKIETYAKKFLGKKYVWGATGPKTFDCSGFTQAVYKQCVGIHIPRVSRNQAKVGKYIKFKDLKKGDMVFFDTTKKHLGKVNHVGIYLSKGNFIHASSGGKKVMITNFNKKRFYKKRFLWGRRILQEHTTVATLVKHKERDGS